MDITISGGIMFTLLVIAVILTINKNVDKYNLDSGLKWDFLEAFFASFVFGIFELLYILITYRDLVFDPQNYRSQQ